MFLARAGRLDEALAAFDDLLVREPGNVQALLERAAVRLRAGAGPGARRDLDEVLRLAPGRAGQVEAIVQLGAGRWLDAVEAALAGPEPLFRDIVIREVEARLLAQPDHPDAERIKERLAAHEASRR